MDSRKLISRIADSKILQESDFSVIALAGQKSSLIVSAVNPLIGEVLANEVSKETVALVLKNLQSRVERILPSKRRAHLIYNGTWPLGKTNSLQIKKLANEFGASNLKLTVFFADASCDLLGGFRQLVGPAGRFTAHFIGSVPPLDDGEVASLLNRGVKLSQVGGLPGTSLNLERLSDLCKRGLRVPVRWYVHSENIGTVLDEASSVQDVTFHSGVSFEPIISHPNFDLSRTDLVPDPDKYAEFLVSAYQRFPHCDIGFAPIWEIAENIRVGCWSRDDDNYSAANFVLDDSCNLREFRQIPALAKERIELSQSCQKCVWRGACGGCERAEKKLFDLVCGYRMLFCEYLLRKTHEVVKNKV